VTKSNGLEELETRQDLHHVVAAKPSRKPDLADRIGLWLSTSRSIDGLWVGTTESKPHPGLRRVEDALQLIKLHAPLHYSRVVRQLERIWVRVEHTASACYYRSMGACVLDERYVLRETTAVDEIAASIVHEATHARLERRGIQYVEKQRRGSKLCVFGGSWISSRNCRTPSLCERSARMHWSGASVASTTSFLIPILRHATRRDPSKHCAI